MEYWNVADYFKEECTPVSIYYANDDYLNEIKRNYKGGTDDDNISADAGIAIDGLVTNITGGTDDIAINENDMATVGDDENTSEKEEELLENLIEGGNHFDIELPSEFDLAGQFNSLKNTRDTLSEDFLIDVESNNEKKNKYYSKYKQLTNSNSSEKKN